MVFKLLKNAIKRFLIAVNQKVFYTDFQKEMLKAKKTVSEGVISLFGKQFYYHHGIAFYVTYQEIFVKGIYNFKTDSKKPVILDCGANMGLSVLFFSRNFPNAEIFAFEPDKKVLSYLEKNIASQNLKNVHLIQKGVWSSETILKFYTDSGMGGRLAMKYNNQIPEFVPTIRLRDYLERPITFLKMDIEGAEYEVLNDIEDRLTNIENVFLEYHSIFDEEQHLDEILAIFKRNGFRYHLSQSFSRNRPFIDKNIGCEKYDMAINIYAYKS
ncbi:FkbM family methyltransferase [Flavobacterium daejeonense]|uniref:FkbM family methyltransferase n=1 Tax=Flavobacterium daejeonense TaxID=350893 RepID=UPI000479AA68|nr:FkbM family methyltransferase [Flavobacterium daejeonense]